MTANPTDTTTTDPTTDPTTTPPATVSDAFLDAAKKVEDDLNALKGNIAQLSALQEQVTSIVAGIQTSHETFKADLEAFNTLAKDPLSVQPAAGGTAPSP